MTIEERVEKIYESAVVPTHIGESTCKEVIRRHFRSAISDEESKILKVFKARNGEMKMTLNVYFSSIFLLVFNPKQFYKTLFSLSDNIAIEKVLNRDDYIRRIEANEKNEQV